MKIDWNCSSLIMMLILPIFSAGETQPDLQALNWLLGDWIAEDDLSLTRESWYSVTNRTFEGIDFTMKKSSNDTVTVESLRLLSMNTGIFYLAKVDHNTYPVAFRLTQSNDSLAVFEKPEHDFPTEITYQRFSSDTLKVVVKNNIRSFTINYIPNNHQ